jgi:hypothetical protein
MDKESLEGLSYLGDLWQYPDKAENLIFCVEVKGLRLSTAGEKRGWNLTLPVSPQAQDPFPVAHDLRCP